MDEIDRQGFIPEARIENETKVSFFFLLTSRINSNKKKSGFITTWALMTAILLLKASKTLFHISIPFMLPK